MYCTAERTQNIKCKSPYHRHRSGLHLVNLTSCQCVCVWCLSVSVSVCVCALFLMLLLLLLLLAFCKLACLLASQDGQNSASPDSLSNTNHCEVPYYLRGHISASWISPYHSPRRRLSETASSKGRTAYCLAVVGGPRPAV